MSLLPWPDVTGARRVDGAICIEMMPSRSKQCATRLLFQQTQGAYETDEMLAYAVEWEDDFRTVSILGRALWDLVNRKASIPYDRGWPAYQLLNGDTLIAYEAGYRACLWARYVWVLGYGPNDFHEAISKCIVMETLSKERVAYEDLRTQAARVEGADASDLGQEKNYYNPRRTFLKDQVAAILERKHGV